MISISATEIADQIDINDAQRARPIHKADSSQTFSIALPFGSAVKTADQTGLGGGGVLLGRKKTALASTPTATVYTVGVISLSGGFGGPHPLWIVLAPKLYPCKPG
jgi:hypothetical protein